MTHVPIKRCHVDWSECADQTCTRGHYWVITNPAEPARPVGSFGYCLECYHPLDRCSHCDQETIKRAEALVDAALARAEEHQ